MLGQVNEFTITFLVVFSFYLFCFVFFLLSFVRSKVSFIVYRSPSIVNGLVMALLNFSKKCLIKSWDHLLVFPFYCWIKFETFTLFISLQFFSSILQFNLSLWPNTFSQCNNRSFCISCIFFCLCKCLALGWWLYGPLVWIEFFISILFEIWLNQSKRCFASKMWIDFSILIILVLFFFIFEKFSFYYLYIICLLSQPLRQTMQYQ